MSSDRPSPSETLPVAVWSGEIRGVKVHVLDNGQRVIDAEDMDRLFGLMVAGCAEDGAPFDVEGFAADFKRFMEGPVK